MNYEDAYIIRDPRVKALVDQEYELLEEYEPLEDEDLELLKNESLLHK